MANGKRIGPGDKFGRLTVIKKIEPYVVPKTGKKKSKFLCSCECGNTTEVHGSSLIGGITQSCGCLKEEKLLKHGYSSMKNRHPLYRVWDNMKTRCYNPNNKRYKAYGARGISVCDEWRHNFQIFFDWCMNNGWKENLQIDRINNDGNYEPSNCRFVTNTENQRNRQDKMLDEEKVKKIVELRKTTGWGSNKIAKQLGVSITSVGGVLYGNNWKGVKNL